MTLTPRWNRKQDGDLTEHHGYPLYERDRALLPMRRPSLTVRACYSWEQWAMP
jgi:hypothetical protein